MTSDAIYTATGIHKEYRMNRVRIPVLKGIDMRIDRGEILSIVGLSGVGKSTLLNILGLLDSPTRGSLLYRKVSEAPGRDLVQLSPHERAQIRNEEFGFVFQFYHLLPDLSVLENVMLPVMILKSRRDFRRERYAVRRRAEELLDRVGILERKDFPPSRLSGGERQRTAIARALMNQPQVVFCDEPTGNLDTETGERIHRLIVDLNKNLNVAFVLVTHDEGLANLAHRRLHMRDGLFL